MSSARERDVTKTFVGLASDLTNGVDIIEMLSSLTTGCARLLDIASAGLLLADRHNVLHLMAASSEATHDLEIFQLQRQEGPCLDCYRSHGAVSAPDLDEATPRWPSFATAARNFGFFSVHAVPMRHRGDVLGTLGLFGTARGALNQDDLDLAQGLADVASIAIVHDAAAHDAEQVNEQLQAALKSRVAIEQAKGVLAQYTQLTMADAFTVLRKYARDRNLKLTAVAHAVVARELSPRVLIEAHRAHAGRAAAE
jgi:GAF domain-containing protein